MILAEGARRTIDDATLGVVSIESCFPSHLEVGS